MQGATSAYSPIRATRSGAQFSPNELDSLTLNGVMFGLPIDVPQTSTIRRARARHVCPPAGGDNLQRLPELDTEKLTPHRGRFSVSLSLIRSNSSKTTSKATTNWLQVHILAYAARIPRPVGLASDWFEDKSATLYEGSLYVKLIRAIYELANSTSTEPLLTVDSSPRFSPTSKTTRSLSSPASGRLPIPPILEPPTAFNVPPFLSRYFTSSTELLAIYRAPPLLLDIHTTRVSIVNTGA
ncbi:hypothetical protein B0H14DRAFT_3631056 [Mycena olivaceomarginata]|nr:hypothetical protein B0H14DRAFT_3631056 [Mycena olivaceomarginata]